MFNRIKEKRKKRERRRAKIRKTIKGTESRPRLSVFRSNKHIYLQFIDDSKGRTIFSFSDLDLAKVKKEELKEIFLPKKIKNDLKGKKLKAYQVGFLAAKKAQEKKIKKVVFDRGGFKYHGRVKFLAEGARQGGLVF